MKRSRDDVVSGGGGGDGGLQLTPAINSEQRPQTVAGGSGHAQRSSDAHTYLKNVKDVFRDKQEKYIEFLDVMKAFKAQRINGTGFLERVKKLFRGHPELILGFNAFVPKGYEIVLSQEDELEAKKAVELEEAVQLVHKIRTDAAHVYRSYLEILSKFRDGTKSAAEVHQEVSALLHNQPDLLNEVSKFLSVSSATACSHSSRTHKPLLGDRSLPVGTMKPVDSGNKEIACHADRDVRSDCDASTNMADSYQDNDHKTHGEKEKVRRAEKEQKHSQDTDFDNHGMNSVTHKHKSANTLEDTITKRFHQGINDHKTHGEKEKVRREDRQQKHSQDTDFDNHPMNSDTHKHKSVNTLEDTVIKTFQQGINDHKTHGEKEKVRREDRGHKSANTLEDTVTKTFHQGSLSSGHVPGSLKSKDQDQDENHEYQATPIRELDFSDCEQCTPSYRLLPKNYPIPSVSQRTMIGAEVLNDHWVSVTSGSEDYSFKHKRNNQYEESLFRCEEDRFELDMLLETVNVTIRRVEKLIEKINNNSIKTDCVVRVEDHFTPLSLRCIERLYGENQLDMMDALRKNASFALPVILTRLKQKQEEWARCRFDFNKVWAEIYAKNFHKSLDHRSFYFKQQDSKSLNAKALLVEIKEISEEKSKGENNYHHFVTAERQNTTPHQEFKYCDLDVHDNIHQLLKYYIPQNCTPEQFDRVMKIWTSFVEPMFNVPIRPLRIAKNGQQTEGKSVRKTLAQRSSSSRDNKSFKEREEGELSPTGYSEETYQNGCHEMGLENETNEEGKDSAHRSSCDRSGSETADVEDLSPEGHDGVHDNKAESEGGTEERFLETVKPITKYAPSGSHNDKNGHRVFYGSDAFYVFFRLHQTLYSRLKDAKENSANAKWRGSNETTPNDSYARFLDLLYTFLVGDVDSAKYEDECRTVLGTWSFPLFTLDKLFYMLSKQLLAIAMDEVDNKFLHLYTYEHLRKPGRFVDELYHANARAIASDDNIYRFESSLISKTDSQTRLTIRLMDPECDAPKAPSFSVDPSFEAFSTNQVVPSVPGKNKAPIFLKRNKRKYMCEDEDLAMTRAMEGLHILNMMECKINCTTQKMSYVLDTEDFMVRKGRRKVRTRSNAFANFSNGYSHKVQKFHKLLQSRILCMPT